MTDRDIVNSLLIKFGQLEHRAIEELSGTITASYTVSKEDIAERYPTLGRATKPDIPGLEAFFRPLNGILQSVYARQSLSEESFIRAFEQTCDLSQAANRGHCAEWTRQFIARHLKEFSTLVLTPVAGAAIPLAAMVVSAQCLLLIACSRFEEAYHLAGKFVYEYVRLRAEQSLALKREARRGKRS